MKMPTPTVLLILALAVPMTTLFSTGCIASTVSSWTSVTGLEGLELLDPRATRVRLSSFEEDDVQAFVEKVPNCGEVWLDSSCRLGSKSFDALTRLKELTGLRVELHEWEPSHLASLRGIAKLRSLVLDGGLFVQSNVVWQFPQIGELTLIEVMGQNRSVLTSVAAIKTLRILDTTITFEGIEAVDTTIAKMELLESLCIRGAGVTDEVLSKCVRLGNLTSFRAINVHASGAFLKAIQSDNNIQAVSIVDCPDFEIKNLSLLDRCKKVKEIEFSGSVGVADLMDNLSFCKDRLTDLRLNRVRIAKAGIQRIWSLPKLSRLKLSNCTEWASTNLTSLTPDCPIIELDIGGEHTGLSVQQLHIVVASLAGLQRVSLIDNPLVDREALDGLLKVAPKLTSLDISGCKRISERDVGEIRKKNGHLSIMHEEER
ncbi:hypothetical protein PLCT2_00315 [Planctomycetaceae bacterium]|nr:hypothetical protein PLCT2_00315 [Planctomycetaceae bacterium]